MKKYDYNVFNHNKAYDWHIRIIINPSNRAERSEVIDELEDYDCDLLFTAKAHFMLLLDGCGFSYSKQDSHNSIIVVTKMRSWTELVNAIAYEVSRVMMPLQKEYSLNNAKVMDIIHYLSHLIGKDLRELDYPE